MRRLELLGQNGLTGSHRFILEKFPVAIGSSREAGVQLVDPDVKPKHCELMLSNGGFVVRDLKTEGGTYVNNRRVESAKLRSGDKIRVGSSVFVVNVLEDW